MTMDLWYDLAARELPDLDDGLIEKFEGLDVAHARFSLNTDQLADASQQQIPRAPVADVWQRHLRDDLDRRRQ